MKPTYNMKNGQALENYRIFPYIAWIMVVLFALFVYNITTDLQETVSDLQAATESLQEQINSDDQPIPQ